MKGEPIPVNLLSKWINSLVEGVDESVGGNEKKKILEKCGNACSRYHGHVERIQTIKKKTKNLDEILEIVNREEMWCGKWKREGNIIYSKCNKICGCPLIVSGMIKPSPTHCYCSHGYMKSVFGEILEKPFEVKLEKSIWKGDEVCHYTVKFEN
ncbi:MAG: hypothetical protein JSV96_05300 [Candidatus Aminicenantes bacterium]|nr:MAG: hypothetical protein JSV96_05300 [Candidatus Aminicenantes bacterium]